VEKHCVFLDVCGAFILYDEEFPAGGEHYNFMWRAGPTLSYSFGHAYGIGVSYRWMHVSNGQGLTPNNPSYEAKGIGIQLRKAF